MMKKFKIKKSWFFLVALFLILVLVYYVFIEEKAMSADQIRSDDIHGEYEEGDIVYCVGSILGIELHTDKGYAYANIDDEFDVKYNTTTQWAIGSNVGKAFYGHIERGKSICEWTVVDFKVK